MNQKGKSRMKEVMVIKGNYKCGGESKTKIVRMEIKYWKAMLSKLEGGNGSQSIPNCLEAA